jgi:hypothetical protein
MTATKNATGQSLAAPRLNDTTSNTQAADSARRGGSQWRYGSAIEAARALNTQR